MLVKLFYFPEEKYFLCFFMYLLLILPKGSTISVKWVSAILFTQFNVTFLFPLWSFFIDDSPTSILTSMLHNGHPEIFLCLHSRIFSLLFIWVRSLVSCLLEFIPFSLLLYCLPLVDYIPQEFPWMANCFEGKLFL